jgi:hypothetical protein
MRTKYPFTYRLEDNLFNGENKLSIARGRLRESNSLTPCFVGNDWVDLGGFAVFWSNLLPERGSARKLSQVAAIEARS